MKPPIAPRTDALSNSVWKWNLALPRAKFIDWYISTAIYEIFGEKDVLDIGCFTGANTFYLASIAKSKNRRVLAVDNWSQAYQAGITGERAKILFFAHINLGEGLSKHCELLVKRAIDITDEEVESVDYILHDVNTSNTNEVLLLLNKIKSKTIFIVDDWNKKGRDFDIDVFLKFPALREFNRTKNRFYGAVKFSDEEFTNLKNEVEKL